MVLNSRRVFKSPFDFSSSLPRRDWVLLKNDYILLVFSILSGYSLSVSFDDTSFSILQREMGVFQASCPSLLIYIPTPGNFIYSNEFHCHVYFADSPISISRPDLSPSFWTIYPRFYSTTPLGCLTKNCKWHIKNPTSLSPIHAFPSVFLTSVNGNKYSKLSKPLSITPSNISRALYKLLSSLDKTLAFYWLSSNHSSQSSQSSLFLQIWACGLYV